MPSVSLLELLRTIATDSEAASTLLVAQPALATQALEVGATRSEAARYFIEPIAHYLFAADTALHIAAASYRATLVHQLVALGARVDAANRRRQLPLHYAVEGGPGAPHWDPDAQVATIGTLIDAGADPNAADRGGVTALHRAVRNRCAAAVQELLDRGADPRRENRSGSTPAQLAMLPTGRGGSGSPEAKAQQVEIVRMLSGSARRATKR